MYFQEITYKTAYALGFLAADGWVNKNTLGFALKGSDRNAVIRIRDIVSEELGGRDIRVKDYMSKLNNKEYPACRMTVYSAGLINALVYYGIVQAKSYIDIDYLERIPDKYKMAWVFGYFDGDGGFNHYSRNRSIVSFTGRKKFLIELANYMGYRANLRDINTETSVISIYRNSDAYSFCKEYLEFNSIVQLLERKVEIARHIIDDYGDTFSTESSVSLSNTTIILNTCSNCGNTFYSRLRLDKCAFCNRGISDHIGRSGSAEKTCKLCGKQFMAVNDYDTCVNCRYIEHQKMEHPEKFICQMCGTPIKGRSIHNICRKCASKQQEKASISAEILAELLAIKNYTEIGREYGVSATAIKKKAIKYGLYERKKANYNNTEGIEQQVLNSFLSILNVKKTAEICNIPDWKARGILKKFNSDYGKLIITGEPVTDNFGICYPSVSEAAKQLGDIGYRRHIIENLDRIRATAYGRVYTRITLEDYVEYLKNRDTTDLGKIYNNLLQQLNSMVCE